MSSRYPTDLHRLVGLLIRPGLCRAWRTSFVAAIQTGLGVLIHPVARRAVRGELRLLGVYPRALLRRLRPTRALQFSYHRGSSSLGVAIALLPAMAAEAAVIHLLLPDDWLIAKVVLLGLSAYGAIVLLGLAIGERVHPHELTAESLELRCGTLYRASIPLCCIASVTRRRERAGGGALTVDGDRALG